MKDIFKDWLAGKPGVRLTTNPETLLGNKPVAPVIDLRQRYDIRVTNCGRGVYQAIDLVTYDPEPEATLNVVGWGESPSEATTDLLEKLAELAAQGKPQ